MDRPIIKINVRMSSVKQSVTLTWPTSNNESRHKSQKCYYFGSTSP